jgi:phage gpG-like protein
MADGWLKLSFDSPKLDALREQLAAKATRLHEVLSVKVAAITQMLASKIVSEKLSGQVLHRRTGVLSASVHAEPVTDDGTTIRGSVVSSQGAAAYGKIHEYGTSGRGWEIRATKQALMFEQMGVKVFARRVFHPALPARPFMSTTLEENRDAIIKELADAVAQVLKEK